MKFNGITIETEEEKTAKITNEAIIHNNKLKSFPELIPGKKYNMYCRINDTYRLQRAYNSSWSELTFLYMTDDLLFFRNNIDRITSIPRNRHDFHFKEYKGTN